MFVARRALAIVGVLVHLAGGIFFIVVPKRIDVGLLFVLLIFALFPLRLFSAARTAGDRLSRCRSLCSRPGIGEGQAGLISPLPWPSFFFFAPTLSSVSLCPLSLRPFSPVSPVSPIATVASQRL